MSASIPPRHNQATSDAGHVTVLLDEAVAGLNVNAERQTGLYIDGTFGRGGHSQLLLSQLAEGAQLVAFDKDPQAIAVAVERFGDDARFSIQHESFAELSQVLAGLGLSGQVAGILLDLGVSSPQLDQAERGFSFMREGPLDMRMDTTRGVSAAQWLQDSDADAIAAVLREYGEEKAAWRIAQAIRKHIDDGKALDTTLQLAELIEVSVPAAVRRQAGKSGKHVATRSFQALRIAVNHELEDLEVALDAAVEELQLGGRLVVISFHSLEDRMAKRFIQKHAKPNVPRGLPLAGEWQGKLKPIGKAIKASAAEVAANPRARSAVMRVAERVEPLLPQQAGSDPAWSGAAC